MSSDRFLSFEEARKYARSLRLTSSVKWFEHCKSNDFPNNIPKRPEDYYKNKGWKGYSDWLGNGRTGYLLEGKGRLGFEEARDFVRSLKLNGLNDWISYCKSGKRPTNIPASPHTAYAKVGWKGYGDWTGSGRERSVSFLPFEEARQYVRKLNLKNQEQYRKFCKSEQRPANIPVHPENTYEDKWNGWSDWLRKSSLELNEEQRLEVKDELTDVLDTAIEQLKTKYLPYEEARDYVQKLKLQGQKEWFEYAKSNQRPDFIPVAPYNYYKEWSSFADWLGTSRIRPTKFRSFVDARKYARSLGLVSIKEWNEFCQSGKKPQDIPTAPDVTYAWANQWTNWYDWLGVSRTSISKGAVVRRIPSRFVELHSLNYSLDKIMSTLSEEFPEISEDEIKQIILKSHLS